MVQKNRSESNNDEVRNQMDPQESVSTEGVRVLRQQNETTSPHPLSLKKKNYFLKNIFNFKILIFFSPYHRSPTYPLPLLS